MRLTMADALKWVNAPRAGERARDRGVGARSAGSGGWAVASAERIHRPQVPGSDLPTRRIRATDSQTTRIRNRSNNVPIESGRGRN